METSDTSALWHWATVQAELRNARDAVLKANGLTNDSLKELELQAEMEMTSDVEKLDVGTVQKIRKTFYVYEKAIPKGEAITLKFFRR